MKKIEKIKPEGLLERILDEARNKDGKRFSECRVRMGLKFFLYMGNFESFRKLFLFATKKVEKKELEGNEVLLAIIREIYKRPELKEELSKQLNGETSSCSKSSMQNKCTKDKNTTKSCKMPTKKVTSCCGTTNSTKSCAAKNSASKAKSISGRLSVKKTKEKAVVGPVKSKRLVKKVK